MAKESFEFRLFAFVESKVKITCEYAFPCYIRSKLTLQASEK
jgi:hypothetical protein